MSTYENEPYNPAADPTVDAAEYKPSEYSDDTADVGARGADDFSSNVQADKEDASAARSDDTGRVDQGEVEDLLSATSEDERNRAGTRGGRAHAFRQEAGAMDFDA